MSDYSTFQWALNKAQEIENTQGPGAAQTWLSQLPLEDNVKQVVMEGLLGESVDPSSLSQEDQGNTHQAPQPSQPNLLKGDNPHAIGDAAHGLAEGFLSPQEYEGITNDWNQGLMDLSEGRDLSDINQTIKKDPSQAELGWQPGGRGRGILVGGEDGQRHLHTWPTNPTVDDPQGGLMHGEMLRQFEQDPNVTGRGFEIEPDGQMVNGDPNEAAEIQQHDPRLKNPGEEFTFSHTHQTRWLPRKGSRLY